MFFSQLKNSTAAAASSWRCVVSLTRYSAQSIKDLVRVQLYGSTQTLWHRIVFLASRKAEHTTFFWDCKLICFEKKPPGFAQFFSQYGDLEKSALYKMYHRDYYLDMAVSNFSLHFQIVAVQRVGPTVLPKNRSDGWFLTRGTCVNYRQGKRQQRKECVLGNYNEQSHCHGLQLHCAAEENFAALKHTHTPATLLGAPC